MTTDTTAEIADFLCGAGPNNAGRWFDDAAKEERGAFWWRKYVRSIAAENAALRAENDRLLGAGWQPIETAPKNDGLIALVWVKGWPVIPARYCEDGAGLNEDLPGWYASFQDVWITPSHWMPLSDPPARAALDAKP